MWTGNDINSSVVLSGALPNMMHFNEEGVKVNYLLEEYSLSEDGKELTLTLKDGLEWHDGTPFTTEDIKFTGEYMLKHSLSFYAAMFEAVTDVEIVDDQTMIYSFEQTYKAFINQFGYWISIMQNNIFENVDDPQTFAFAEEYVGYGPYKLSEFSVGEYYIFEKNEDWAIDDWPYLDKIVYRIYPDTNSLVSALEAGEIDATGSSIQKGQADGLGDGLAAAELQSLG